MIRRRAMPASIVAAVVVAVTVFACEAFVRHAEKAAAGPMATLVAQLRADVAAWKATR